MARTGHSHPSPARAKKSRYVMLWPVMRSGLAPCSRWSSRKVPDRPLCSSQALRWPGHERLVWRVSDLEKGETGTQDEEDKGHLSYSCYLLIEQQLGVQKELVVVCEEWKNKIFWLRLQVRKTWIFTGRDLQTKYVLERQQIITPFVGRSICNTLWPGHLTVHEIMFLHLSAVLRRS